MSDVQGLQDQQSAPDIAAVAPVSQGRATLVDGSTNWSTTVSGSTDGWIVTNTRTLGSGTFFNVNDVATRTQVIVLGATTAATLGAGVGDIVLVKQIPFQVIGVLAPAGSQGFGNQDDLAVVPFTTAQDELFGGGVQRILLSATSAGTIGPAYLEANQLLLQTHHISDPSQADFTITPQPQVRSTPQSRTAPPTVLLA